MRTTLVCVATFLLLACFQESDETSLLNPAQSKEQSAPGIWPKQVGDIACNPSFQLDSTSSFFNDYASQIELLPEESPVLLYNGALKQNQSAHFAILDMPVGDKDLQQCADAVMCLRAEFLYNSGKEQEIAFNYTSGDRIDFAQWKSGFKPKVTRNKVSWTNCSSCDASRESFEKYLEAIYMYAGTASLEKELKPKAIQSVEAGDVLIQGGFPGHAVMVLATATNAAGERQMLLAQSYMPAQQIHILKNPNSSSRSPWYSVTEGKIATPEWLFNSADLRAW